MEYLFDRRTAPYGGEKKAKTFGRKKKKGHGVHWGEGATPPPRYDKVTKKKIQLIDLRFQGHSRKQNGRGGGAKKRQKGSRGRLVNGMGLGGVKKRRPGSRRKEKPYYQTRKTISGLSWGAVQTGG